MDTVYMLILLLGAIIVPTLIFCIGFMILSKRSTTISDPDIRKGYVKTAILIWGSLTIASFIGFAYAFSALFFGT